MRGRGYNCDRSGDIALGEEPCRSDELPTVHRGGYTNGWAITGWRDEAGATSARLILVVCYRRSEHLLAVWLIIEKQSTSAGGA